MRRTWAVLAGVVMVLGVGAPAQAQPAESGQGATVTASKATPMAEKGDKGERGDKGGGGDRGDRHDRGGRDRARYDDGRYAGCGYYPDCDPYYGGYRGGYGGYGCGYEYPCDPYSYDRQNSDCMKYEGDKAKRPDNCRYDPGCDCWYKTSESAPPKKDEAKG